MRASSFLLAASSLLLIATTGRSGRASDATAMDSLLRDEPAPPAPADPAVTDPPPKSRVEWYGWQTLGLDAVAGGVLMASESVPLLALPGYLGFLVTGPLVHGAHHHDAVIGPDVLLRLAVPLVAGGIGLATVRCDPNPPTLGAALGDMFCPALGGVRGLGLGMAAVSLFDATVLAWKVHPAEPMFTGATVVPALAPSAHGFSAGLGGVF
jgi:hypothetical protein